LKHLLIENKSKSISEVKAFSTFDHMIQPSVIFGSRNLYSWIAFGFSDLIPIESFHGHGFQSLLGSFLAILERYLHFMLLTWLFAPLDPLFWPR
jgi:hypothetical protein